MMALLGTEPSGVFDEYSTPKAVGSYLVAVRPVVAEATELRRGFIRDLGRLLHEVRLGDAHAIARSTGQLGSRGHAAFLEALLTLRRHRSPAACIECRDAASGWIQMHVEACEVMLQVGRSGDLKRLREAQALLAEGRVFARRFNAEYGHLTAALRARARRRPRRTAR
jgi:hypothetical protein